MDGPDGLLHHRRTSSQQALCRIVWGSKLLESDLNCSARRHSIVKPDKEGTDDSAGVCVSHKAPLNDVLLKQCHLLRLHLRSGRLADTFIQSNLSEERETRSLSGTVGMFIETSAKRLQLLG